MGDYRRHSPAAADPGASRADYLLAWKYLVGYFNDVLGIA
jgi:hypothetical protein